MIGRGRVATVGALLVLVVLLLPVPATGTAQEHAGEPATGAQEAASALAGEHAAAQEPATHEPATAEHDETQDQADHGAAGEHADPEHAGPTWTVYAYKWINFGLLLALMYWLLITPPAFVIENFDFPGLRVVLAQRAQGIVESRRLAAEQQATAARYLSESSDRLARIQEEAAGLVAEARIAAAQDRQRIEEDAVTQAAQIREGASRDLDTEINRARRGLQVHVADLAVGLARRLVRDNLNDEDQDRLVREYLDRFGDTVG